MATWDTYSPNSLRGGFPGAGLDDGDLIARVDQVALRAFTWRVSRSLPEPDARGSHWAGVAYGCEETMILARRAAKAALTAEKRRLRAAGAA